MLTIVAAVAQFTQETSLPKPAFMRAELQPFTGNQDLISTDGQVWKTWRAIFNPGFSTKNLVTTLPWFLEEIQVLKDQLTEASKSGEVILLENMVAKGTTDIICRVVL